MSVELKYCIVSVSEYDDFNFENVKQNPDGLRYSNDGQFFIVKYSGKKPYDLYGKDVLGQEEISTLLNTNPNWVVIENGY